MNKAEDLAKKYCEGSSFEDACMERPAYIAGYHQAEKDLELTWEDIGWIIEEAIDNTPDNLEKEQLCQEVLKRFKTQKRK